MPPHTPPAPPAPPRRKLAEQVARRIEDEIVERGWPVGEVIGAEAELIARYGVSRAAVREAISILEYKQVAAMRRGRSGGLVVRAPAGAVVAEAVAAFFHFADVSVGELYDARITLEVLAARLAARRIGEDEIALLRQVAADDRVERQLSVAIAQATGDPVLSIFVPTLTRVTGALAGDPSDRYDLGTEMGGARRRALQGIAEAIVSGDEARAERRIRRQLEGERAWLDRVREAREAARARSAGGPPASLARRLADSVAGGAAGKLPEKVALLVRQEIHRRGWQTGKVLGNEASLCEELGVSRAVFREAVRILEHNGVARMRQGPGGGLVVQAPDPARVVDALTLYLRYLQVRAVDVYAVRTAVELRAVELAAARAPHGDTADLMSALARERGPRPGSGPVTAEVHLALARLSGNRLLSLFAAVLARLSRSHPPEGVHPPEGGGREPSAAIHEKIAEAVLAGDVSVARHHMSRHLTVLGAWLDAGPAD